MPETTLLGLQPGDVFVHRNIANIISPTDINSSAVIEYAVAHLKVAHIVLCGHTSCGGAAAALGDSRVGGVLDTWLTPLKALRREHDLELKSIDDPAKRAVRLAELNVEMGVENLLANYVVDEHVRTRGVKIHGVLYDISSGKIRDLGVGNNDPSLDLKEEIKETHEKPSAGPAAVVDQADLEVVKGKHGQLVFREDGFAYTHVQ